MASPPSAPRRPHVISAHGDDREDPWFWLREREDPEVLAYLEAENAYTEDEAAPLAALRTGLFEEMKARIKETDMSVPTRRGPWWYYTRTEEGKDYGIHCRRPARGRQELPPAGEPGEEEQILLDENVLAEGSEYFAVGSAAVSHDHRWLAFSTDHRGNEKYELRFRPLDTEVAAAPEAVPDTGYGLAWSAAADYVFYVRLDEAQRPFQLWRHQLGSDPAGDVLVFEEADRRFSLGTGSTRDTAFVLIGLHSTNTTEWLAIPSADPLGEPRVVLPRREGIEYAVDHLTPASGGPGWFVVLTNEDARGLPGPGGPRRRTGLERGARGLARGHGAPSRHPRGGRRRLQQRPRPERAGRGPDPGARPPAARGRPTPSPATCSGRAGSSRPSRAPRRPGWVPTPSPTRPRCASAARHW